jgi:formate dehydrogenase subunit gamma
MLYGRYFLKDLTGPQFFAQTVYYGKLLHNYVAFAFMVGIALILILWIKDNLPSRTDCVWILKGGGLLSKHSHPPAKKFNAGQKVIFWLVILGGVSLSLSGLALMVPFELPMFAKTFALMNTAGFEKLFGFALPTELSPMEEMQLSQLWHSAMALFMVAVIIAHIYIGTIGMEGAFDAMGSGEVDANWAREHHSIWYEKVRTRQNEAGQQPAE